MKDAIEAQGVPHVELGLVTIDGEPAPMARPLAGGERVAAYPRFGVIDPEWPDAPSLPRPRRFALDGHLGTLARRLRLLGLDSWYEGDVDDAELARLSASEHRILLTRDVGLLKRSEVVLGAWVRSVQPALQLIEVVDRFALGPEAAPWTRCLRCNGMLRRATSAEIAAGVPPRARAAHDEFRACPDCGQLYWRGTHSPGLDAIVADVERHVARRSPPDGTR